MLFGTTVNVGFVWSLATVKGHLNLATSKAPCQPEGHPNSSRSDSDETMQTQIGVRPRFALGICYSITKTRLYNFDPLKPHYYIIKLGFAGLCVIFLISAQNIDCGYSLESPRRGGSNEYRQSMF